MAPSSRKILGLAVGGTLVAVLGLVLPRPDTAQGQASDRPQWTYEWTPPTTGTPVAFYEVEISENGVVTRRDTVTTTRVVIDVVPVVDTSIHVRGIDADGNVGPFSGWSRPEAYDEDPPSNTPGSTPGK